MIKPGEIITNKKLQQIFKCSPQGGMRRSIRTSTLVLITDPRGIYRDRWENSALYYTGMGLRGDQSLKSNQNKTLAESNRNGIGVYLFEVVESDKYIYQGRVKLAGTPFEEIQLDLDKKERKVWIFPLKLIDQTNLSPIHEKDFTKAKTAREKAIRQLSDEELVKRVKLLKKQVSERQVLSNRYDSSEEIKELAKRKAKGKCTLCGNDAPFKDKKGMPFLEGHHIMSLADGGPDLEENVVALCPNCHRKMHILDLEEDRELLKQLTKDKKLIFK